MRSVVILLLLAAACASEPVVPAEVTGLITAVERSDRGTITAFTVEDDGEAYDIRIDLGRDYGFDLEHLEEHRAQELPVRVTIEQRGDDAFAVEILDA
jgi:multidrug efflux pump subunit AcrA (membrane-fusion protein)